VQDLREFRALARVWSDLRQKGVRTVLVTLVASEGASYRRPGARMLADESGRTHGYISGGCLEGDLAEHARRVLEDGVPDLISYDLSADSDVAWGLDMGCPGRLEVLLEPFGGPEAERIFGWVDGDGPLLLGTVFASGGEGSPPPGSRWVLRADGRMETIGDGFRDEELLGASAAFLAAGHSLVTDLPGAEPGTRALVEVLTEPRRLCVLGAGPDTAPLLRIMDGMGWRCEVIDARPSPPGRDTYPAATVVRQADPVEAVSDLAADERTAALLTSHNFSRDVALLRALADVPIAYVGMLGSRGRRTAVLADIDPAVIERLGGRLHAPVGLDLGAESPTEIALSIAAELQAVFSGRAGGFLRDGDGSLHG